MGAPDARVGCACFKKARSSEERKAWEPEVGRFRALLPGKRCFPPLRAHGSCGVREEGRGRAFSPTENSLGFEKKEELFQLAKSSFSTCIAFEASRGLEQNNKELSRLRGKPNTVFGFHAATRFPCSSPRVFFELKSFSAFRVALCKDKTWTKSHVRLFLN